MFDMCLMRTVVCVFDIFVNRAVSIHLLYITRRLAS